METCSCNGLAGESSGGDIFGVLDGRQKRVERNTIKNALQRGERAGLLKSARLGWEQPAVDRYIAAYLPHLVAVKVTAKSQRSLGPDGRR